MNRAIFNEYMRVYDVDIAAALVCNQQLLIKQLKANKANSARNYFERCYGKNQIPDFIMKKYNIPYRKEGVEGFNAQGTQTGRFNARRL